MNKRIGILATLALAALAGTVAADGPGWSENRLVTRIVVVNSGGINIRVTPELGGCTSQSGYGQRYASIYPDHPGLKSMLATLLTAQSTGQPVTIYLQDNTCRVGEIVLGPDY